ncbi:hypothetical protein RhiirA5_427271 [Rhizophagus irregularis]|uniref:Uncharacterized protein n=1 Tax=Rhizophagus irregularis TaxID=588596 RepID=A0A2N0P2M9_9GLOM|nr:hypothetical protein RhiirA5_427271 [Rhizophagus irregularis]
MTREIKHLLEIMFHTGTANPRQKMNTQQMHEELLQRAQQGFSRRWKEAMALRSIDENAIK